VVEAVEAVERPADAAPEDANVAKSRNVIACYPPLVDAAGRRAARKNWRGGVFRTWDEAAERDALFWDAIPVEERARVTWELSEELHKIAHPNEPHEPRLSRSIAVVTRR
jgi:hypothetical protein